MGPDADDVKKEYRASVNDLDNSYDEVIGTFQIITYGHRFESSQKFAAS